MPGKVIAHGSKIGGSLRRANFNIRGHIVLRLGSRAMWNLDVANQRMLCIRNLFLRIG